MRIKIQPEIQYNTIYFTSYTDVKNSKETTLGICRISEFIVDGKNRCWQQTVLDAGDWINGLHYNYMYTDLKKVLGINIAFVMHYNNILKKTHSELKMPFVKDRCTFISKYSYQTLSENLKGLKCGSCEQLLLIWHLDSIWTWHKSHKSI